MQNMKEITDQQLEVLRDIREAQKSMENCDLTESTFMTILSTQIKLNSALYFDSCALSVKNGVISILTGIDESILITIKRTKRTNINYDPNKST